MDSSNSDSSLVIPEVNIRVNPFTQSQQAQLRAQIVVFGSVLRNRIPEEALMNLCFADISQVSRIEDFREGIFDKPTWQKAWRALSKKVSAKRPPSSTAVKPLLSQVKSRDVKQHKAKVKCVDKPVKVKEPVKPNKVKEKSISELPQEPYVTVKIKDDETFEAAHSMKVNLTTHDQHIPSTAEKDADPKLEIREDPTNNPTDESNSNLTEKNGDNQTDPVQDDNPTAEETELMITAIQALSSKNAEYSDDLKPEYSKDPGDLAEELQLPEEFVEGTHVEVISYEEGLRGVWFAGKILSIQGGKLQVVYDDLLDEDGKELLQECVNCYNPQTGIPKVRLPHPITSAKLPVKNMRPFAGDRVDVWMNDGWWEAIVKGIDNRKEVTLYFPGENDYAKAKVCNLRPSLIWTDNQWVPWTREPVHKLVKEEPVILDGKRKREKCKRYADMDDEHVTTKPGKTKKVKKS